MEELNIFPFIEASEDDEEEIEEELPLAREYAWDFEKKDFKYRNGKMYLVEGTEAIKIWIWKLLKTDRFRYLIYSWDYGHELKELVGRGYTPAYTDAEVKRYIEEAIEYNLGGYVNEIRDTEVTFEGSKLSMNIIVNTIYGEVEYIE